MTCRTLLVGVALTAALAGCKKDRDEASPTSAQPGVPAQTETELDAPLATIDDVTITVREFQERINRQSPYIRARYTSLEQKKEFLDNLVRFEVLAKEALRRGFDKDPDVVRTMKQVMIQKLMREEFEDRIKPEDITDAEMQAFFEENRDEYNKPEEVRVSAIILRRKAQADKVAEKALGDEGASNKGFRALVARHSVDEETKLRGGDLRYFSRSSQEIPQPVVDAAFALEKTGDVAGPIAGNDGRFYIIKQTGRRKAVRREFDQVKRQIQNRLYRDKRTQSQASFIDDLRKKATIKVFDSNLRKVRIDTSNASHGSTDDHGHSHGTAPAFPADPAPADPPPAASEQTEEGE